MAAVSLRVAEGPSPSAGRPLHAAVHVARGVLSRVDCNAGDWVEITVGLEEFPYLVARVWPIDGAKSDDIVGVGMCERKNIGDARDVHLRRLRRCYALPIAPSVRFTPDDDDAGTCALPIPVLHPRLVGGYVRNGLLVSLPDARGRLIPHRAVVIAPTAGNRQWWRIGSDTRISFEDETKPNAPTPCAADMLQSYSDEYRLLASLFSAAFAPATHAHVRTALLTGPSGTGKSTVARVLATAHGAALLAPTAASIASAYPGEPERGMLEWFSRARAASPALLLFDDAESIFPAGDFSDEGDATPAERRLSLAFGAALEQLQAESAQSGAVVVLVVATDGSRLDPLVVGRTDIHVTVSAPSPALRALVFSRLLGASTLPPWADGVLERCQGMSGGQLVTVVRDAYARALARVGTHATLADTTSDDFHACLDRLRRPVGAGAVTARWDAVAGLAEAKAALNQAVTWAYRHADALARMGVAPPKGVLLYGPPGTGKTLLARAVASESSASFFSLSIADVLRGEVGESERILRETFAAARHARPSVLFIDEIQALFGHRAGPKDGGGNVNRTLVTQLLLEMDSLDTCRGVVVLGATNAPHALDPALLSAGRFERILFVPPPDESARVQLLSLLRDRADANSTQWDEDVDLARIAAATEGFTGADMRSLVRQATVESLKRRMSSLTSIATDAGDVASHLASTAPTEAPTLRREDFDAALRVVSASVGVDDVRRLALWRPGGAAA